MSRCLIHPGDKFGRLTVVSRAENNTHKQLRWNCMCDCGNAVTIVGMSLRNGMTRSCGCIRVENSRAQIRKHCHGSGTDSHSYSHGHCSGKDSPTYQSWRHMIDRCTNINSTQWDYYGGQGITVCDRWNPAQGGSFENFLADMGERPEGMTLGRILDLGNYEPGNCFWMTGTEQRLAQRNKRALLKTAGARLSTF